MHINEQSSLSCIEINPPTPAKKSIIWLHGLGANGNDFVPIVPELQLPSSLAVRFVFPHAPVRPVTINNGYEMPAWFDIYDMSIAAKIDHIGISNSVSMVEKLIAQEQEKGIPSNHIVLAGFSQGAVIALITGLCYSKPLAGIMALSGYLPLANDILTKANEVNRTIPIFIAHGTEDNIVPYALGKLTYDALKQAGYSAAWHSFPMAHSVCTDEIKSMHSWIMKVLGPSLT